LRATLDLGLRVISRPRSDRVVSAYILQNVRTITKSDFRTVILP